MLQNSMWVNVPTREKREADLLQMLSLGKSRELAHEYGKASLRKTGEYKTVPDNVLPSQLPTMILELEYDDPSSSRAN